MFLTRVFGFFEGVGVFNFNFFYLNEFLLSSNLIVYEGKKIQESGESNYSLPSKNNSHRSATVANGQQSHN